MSNDSEILEKHVFISKRKEREIYLTVFNKIFTFPIANISIEYEDRPDDYYSTINNRIKTILLNLSQPEKITCISGNFCDGGSFKLQNGNLYFTIREDEYNYELLETLKNFLNQTFPLWIFKNPYIWGVTIYEPYERQHFFDVRNFSKRSRLLEEPEVDIYRRDNGIIHKYRFFMREEMEIEEGMRYLEPYFWSLIESLNKRNYEGLEVLSIYCTNKNAFRKFEPRTKIGKEIKSMLNPDK